MNTVELVSHKRDWENLASTDPLWAILSDPNKKDRRWNVDEFMDTGVSDATLVIERASSLGLPHKRESCLDFGCGVGRVTRAFSSYFTKSVGVDISEAMLTHARRLAPHCVFRSGDGFDFAGPFDLVYCSQVLQHQPAAALAMEYIGKLLGAVAPRGVLVFQLPSHIPLKHRIQPRRRLYRLFESFRIPSQLLMRWGLQPIRMIAIPETTVRAFVESRGARVMAVFPRSESKGVMTNDYYCSWR